MNTNTQQYDFITDIILDLKINTLSNHTTISMISAISKKYCKNQKSISVNHTIPAAIHNVVTQAKIVCDTTLFHCVDSG